MTRRHLLAAVGALPLAAQDIPRASVDYDVMLPEGRRVKPTEFKGKVLAFACILTT